MVYQFWDIYIMENDPTLILFICLAIISESKEQMLNADVFMVPQILARLRIENISQITYYLKKAKELKIKTPLSFHNQIQELDVFKKTYLNQNNVKAVVQSSLEIIEQSEYVKMSPYEIVNTLYSKKLRCCNTECPNFKRNDPDVIRKGGETESASDNSSVKQTRKGSDTFVMEDLLVNLDQPDSEQVFSDPCIFCKVNEPSQERMQLVADASYITKILKYKSGPHRSLEMLILDFRTNKTDFLPKSHSIDLSKADTDSIKFLLNEMAELKTFVHFVFMTTEFDSVAYKIHIKETQKERPRIRSVPLIQNNQKSDMHEEIIMFRFLEAFQNEGFPYLSVLEGGFEGVSRVMHKTNIEFLGHSQDNCRVCNESNRNRKGSLFGFVKRVFYK